MRYLRTMLAAVMACVAVWAGPLELDAARQKVTAKVATPAEGFAAFMVELSFAADNGGVYRLSTQVQVTLDAF